MNKDTETNHIHQGKKVMRRETEKRTCRGCLYSSTDGSGHCHKPFTHPKCMKDGKEFIFIVEEQ